MQARTIRSGELARRAGVNVETLRYYERRGLLPEPPRSASSRYREYPEEAVARLRFVKRAQELGFTLREVEELLALRDDTASSCRDVRAAARTKVSDVEGRIRSLQRMRRALGRLVDSCTSDGSTRECPILEALADEADAPTRRSPPPGRSRR